MIKTIEQFCFNFSNSFQVFSFITIFLLILYFPLSIECQTPKMIIQPLPTTATVQEEHVATSTIKNSLSTDNHIEATTMNPKTIKEDFETSRNIYDHPLIRKKFQLPPNYNKEMRPARFNESVVVEFEIHVQAINPIKAADMDFRMEVLLSLRWTDLRLNFSADEYYDSEHLILPTELIDSIWHPDPYIVNAKQTDVGQLTGRLVKVYIYPNHTVIYSTNLFVTVACAMRFQYYPFDYQLCPMIIESFSYDQNKVTYKWSKFQKFTVNPRLRLLQFVVTYPLVAEECTITRIKEDYNVSQLIAYFRFDRLLGNHLIQTFSPCSLVTALSWLSFWFELDAIPARVSLLVTSLLILVTQFSGLKVDMPPVAYIKAVDVWMAGCMVFVFFALGEFVIVKIIYTKTETLKHQLMMHGQNGREHGCSNPTNSTDDDGSTSTSQGSGTTASMKSGAPMVPAAASSPVKPNQAAQSRLSNERSAELYSNTRNESTASPVENIPPKQYQQQQQPPPPITLIRSLAQHRPKLGVMAENIIDGKYNNLHKIQHSSPLNIRVPFCCGFLMLPLIWTNEKTKRTHVLWKQIDAISRWVFPVIFGLFLMIYWLVLFIHSRINAPPSQYNTC